MVNFILDEINIERCYLIYSTLEYVEFNTFEEAFDSKDVLYVIKTTEGKWHNNYDNVLWKNPGAHYDIYNTHQKKVNEFVTNNWKAIPKGMTGPNWTCDTIAFNIHSLNDNLDRADDFWIKYEDYTLGRYRKIDKIIFTLRLLRQLNNFSCWNHYDLYLENIELKKKIELLENNYSNK